MDLHIAHIAMMTGVWVLEQVVVMTVEQVEVSTEEHVVRSRLGGGDSGRDGNCAVNEWSSL